MGSGLETLEQSLNWRFSDLALLRHALTHRSAVAEAERVDSNERLEFLGDRVLGLVVTDMLMGHFTDEAEGQLARRYAALVQRAALVEVAQQIALGDFLISQVAHEDAMDGGASASMMADCCEAVIGALYCDGGLAAARGFIEPYWAPLLAQDRTPPKDAKTALQEWAQQRGLALPEYRQIDRQGPDHAPHFHIEVATGGYRASGEGSSKRRAQLSAAEALLAQLSAAEHRHD